MDDNFTQVNRRTPSRLKWVLETILLSITSLLYACKVVISIYGWFGEPSTFRFNVTLRDALPLSQLTISPADWTQVIWLVVFFWEALWLIFVWTFTCRQRTPRTIHPGVILMFGLACALNVGWLFSLGHLHQESALALIATQTIVLVTSVATLTVHLHLITSQLQEDYRLTIWVTRGLVLNGLAAYTVWSDLIMWFSLGGILQDDAALHRGTTSTVVLSLIAVSVLAYFLLENTILDRFLRHVFVVYPVVIVTLAGVLAENWDKESTRDRNELFALILTCFVGLLLLIRVVLLVVVYPLTRPLALYEKGEDYLPS